MSGTQEFPPLCSVRYVFLIGFVNVAAMVSMGVPMDLISQYGNIDEKNPHNTVVSLEA